MKVILLGYYQLRHSSHILWGVNLGNVMGICYMLLNGRISGLTL